MLLLLLPAIAFLVFLMLRPLPGAVALVVLAALPWAVAQLAFTRSGLWIPIVIPTAIQLPLAYMVSLVWYYLPTVREL